MVKAQLGDKTHWHESSDLDMMFTGTYTSGFYRAVRNLLHEQVAQPQSADVPRRWDELVSQEATFRTAPRTRPADPFDGRTSALA
jgi:anaerobic magnesium-protoporphyrin IX monomethyl ester cyclase